MRPSWRSIWCRGARAAALALVIIGLLSGSARAQLPLLGGGVVFDPSNFARNVLHYVRRLEQMQMQAQQLRQQLTAMRKLANPEWRRIDGTLADVEAAMRQGQALAYGTRSIDQEFARTFPGARAFQDYPTEQGTQSARTLATLRGALDAASRSANDLPASAAQLEAMKSQFGSIQGHEEALELDGTIGLYSAQELTLVRQALAALTNVEAVTAANAVNAQAQEQATLRARLQALSAPGPRREAFSLRVAP
jgi:type IV secretion system protein TrbJ